MHFITFQLGRDRKFTVAAANMENGVQHFIAYMVLVFGSKSSPTIWGRFAALLGRSLAAVCKETHTQIYVDDPIFVVPSAKGFDKVECLTRAFLWTEVLGYPLKLSKAHAGDSIDWIGARINLDNVKHEVTVTIPSEKITSLVESVEEFLGLPSHRHKEAEIPCRVPFVCRRAGANATSISGAAVGGPFFGNHG